MHQVLEAMNQAHNVYNRDRIQSWAGSELKKVQEITQEAQLKFRAHQAQAWSMFGPGPLGLSRQPQLYETDHMDHDIMLVKNMGVLMLVKKNKRRNRPRPKFRAQRHQWDGADGPKNQLPWRLMKYLERYIEQQIISIYSPNHESTVPAVGPL